MPRPRPSQKSPAQPEETPPGYDFLRSLQSFFREAIDIKKPEYLTKTDFIQMNSAIITFLQACDHQKTAASARAEAPILLPGGREPHTRIALPPKDFRLQEKLREKLMKLKSGEQFVGILQAAINKAYGIKTPRKRKAVCETGSALAVKREKLMVPNELLVEVTGVCETALPEPGIAEARHERDANVEKQIPEKKQADENAHPAPETANKKHQDGNTSSPPVKPEAQQDNQSTTIQSVTEVPEVCASGTPNTTTLARVHSTSLHQYGSESDSYELHDDPEQQKLSQIARLTGKSRYLKNIVVRGLQSCDGDVEATMTWLRLHGDSLDTEIIDRKSTSISAHNVQFLVPKGGFVIKEIQPNSPTQREELTNATDPGLMASADPNTGAESPVSEEGHEKQCDKPRTTRLKLTHRWQASTPFTHSLLIDHLASKAVSIPAEALEEVLKASKRAPLPSLLPFAALYPKLAKLPAGTWAVYQSQIERLYYSGKLQDMHISQRLRKISKICVTPEVERAIGEGKWERVKAAVVIAGFLAEMTGPEKASDGEKNWVNDWAWEKMREIEFFRDTAQSK